MAYELKKIGFTFENCEYIEIDGKYIGGFCASDIRTSIQRIACNAINKMETIYSLSIEIYKSADNNYSSFGILSSSIFSRLLKYQDITSVDITLDMDNCESETHYYVQWVGNDDYSNDAQKTYLSDLGNLYIVIDAHKDIKDFWDIDMINNAEYVG